MKLKYIEFILENCDSIKIEGKYIGNFLVEDIKTSIQRIACNAINRMDTANTFVIEIHKDANKERYQFDQTQREDFKQMTFDRLTSSNDITSIEFELEEAYPSEQSAAPCREHYHYYVKWEGESDYTNEAQKTYLSMDGNLYIVIADGKKIEDIFDINEIEDKEYMDFHFDMCNIGDKYSNPERYNDDADESDD